MRFFSNKNCLIYFFMILFATSSIKKSNAVEIIIFLPTNSILTAEFTADETVYDIKNFIYNASLISQENQRIFFNSEEMDNLQPLSTYSLVEGDTIYVKYGTGGMIREQQKSHGFLTLLFGLVILGIVIIILKKTVFSKPKES